MMVTATEILKMFELADNVDLVQSNHKGLKCFEFTPWVWYTG